MPTWIAVSQALMTLVIALLALYVAWQQSQTARRKFRLDYFNRRFPIYEAAMRLAAEIAGKRSVSDEALHGFLVSTRGAEFFFNDDIARYCKTLHDEALAVRSGCDKLEAPLPDSESRSSQERLGERVEWFSAQLDEIPRKFGAFLKIEGRA